MESTTGYPNYCAPGKITTITYLGPHNLHNSPGVPVGHAAPVCELTRSIAAPSKVSRAGVGIALLKQILMSFVLSGFILENSIVNSQFLQCFQYLLHMTGGSQRNDS